MHSRFFELRARFLFLCRYPDRDERKEEQLVGQRSDAPYACLEFFWHATPGGP